MPRDRPKPESRAQIIRTRLMRPEQRLPLLGVERDQAGVLQACHERVRGSPVAVLKGVRSRPLRSRAHPLCVMTVYRCLTCSEPLVSLSTGQLHGSAYTGPSRSS
jgi:hypothetical protein